MPVTFNHNLMSQGVSKNLEQHYARLVVSVERLSSGLRINSAADDAAGLAIRELMRADVAAFNQGVRNASDAISMIQVADGALGVIDEKLIRMKELAEQAATGTYNSTQRLMIHSEFVAMGEEIDRIARATDFNGIHLLDGSLSGEHSGKRLNATGAMKIHFGTSNDSAEDYYYIEIADCTLAGLGLTVPRGEENAGETGSGSDIKDGQGWIGTLADSGIQIPPDLLILDETTVQQKGIKWTTDFFDFEDHPRPGTHVFHPDLMSNLFQQGIWYSPQMGNLPVPELNTSFIVPKGTKNFVLATYGSPQSETGQGDNDIEVFALDPGRYKYGPYSMVHLVGTDLETDPAPLAAYTNGGVYRYIDNFKNFGYNSKRMDTSTVNTSFLNTGPATYDPAGNTLQYMRFHGMTIGYSGDPDKHDSIPDDGILQDWPDFEILVIDELTEDLVISVPGFAATAVKMYWNLPASHHTPVSPDNPIASGGHHLRPYLSKHRMRLKKPLSVLTKPL